MDVSGSVSYPGFDTEKEFIDSLLSKISVQPIATRVSIITFGYHVEKNIDQIDYDVNNRHRLNKCEFKKDVETRVKHRRGGATNMNGALKKAKEIIDRAKARNIKRINVNTVIVMLTDGYWNQGGSPSNVARELRGYKYHVDIFSVGVGYNLYSVLRDVSGSHDNVITANNFADFGSLATRIRGDQHEKIYLPVSKSNCGITCDPKATCSCGTLSGIYQCACLPGYKGSGIYGQCHKCPHGTYKTFTSPDANCKPCPANSITRDVGSTSISACYCRRGFTGYPNLGEPCKPVKCAALPNKISNGKVTSCGNYYKETCTFTCNKNYNIVNEVVTSKKLTCLIDGTWDQAMPACVATTCQLPLNPPKVSSDCSGNKVGDKCSFKCAQGYNLIGTNERECKSNGQWSHSLPHCEVVTCPPVRKIDNVNIVPVNCMKKSTNFNDGCAYSCKPGFKYIRGDQKRVCSHDGTWIGNELVCKDLTPPTINCPEPIFAETEAGQSFKEITWVEPTVIDNSITGSDDITVSHIPANIKSPYKFPIGLTLVEFTASDQNGNTDKCTFRVEVIDRELPKFIQCPKNIVLTAERPDVSYQHVSWEEPKFIDNSGVASLIYSPPYGHSNNFSIGPVHNVRYVIQDGSRLTADCSFVVHVKAKTCPAHDPPINGALSCRYLGGNVGSYCTALCQNPYTFNGPAAYGYVCGPTAQWNVIPPSFPFPWPDCTILQPQQGMGQHLRFFYYSGNCASSKNQIQNNFIAILDRFLRNEGGCSDPSNARVCEAKKVQVTCGSTQPVSNDGRVKRNAQNELTIDIDIDVKSKEDIKTQENAVKSLTNYVKGVQSQSSSEAQHLKKISVAGDTLVLERVEAVGSISAICADGQVFGTVKVGQFSEKKTCMSCLAGQYYSAKTSKCEKCPIGTYTEKPGLLGCPPCPRGTTTISDGTSNSTHCRKPCVPGTFSEDGLAPCQECPIGTYQSNSLAISCNKCPGAAVTTDLGSTGLSQCRMRCAKGMYSKTGLEPCAYCDKGFYQPEEGQKDCIRCSGKDSTHGIGSQEKTQCRYINNCVSSPCLNGGVCSNELNDFSCSCKPGYRGKRCQEEKNECADKPCYGNAACVDKINGFECICPPNFSGRFCADPQPRCRSDFCQNGGECGESPNGPICLCKPGWTGKFCERTVNECDSKPCGPGSQCVDSHRGYSCICAAGYTGPTCHELIDNCAQNDQCLNDGQCVNGVGYFTCQCKLGFGGDRCEVNIDDCSSNPCRNGAICIDGVNSYKCKCAAEYYGDHCQHFHASNDFDLVFDRKVQGYAETDFYQELKEFTASFWLKVKKDVETGTIMSYSYGSEESFQDNGFVIRDPDNLALVLLGEEAGLDIAVTDDQWHHVAITWSSQNGRYRGYKDGLKISEGTLMHGKVIPAHGVFVLGQEQDEIGRNFSAAEAFNGRLSQFNLWQNVLSDSEIEELASYRCIQSAGNVIAWADFETLQTNEVKREVGFCSVKNTKFSRWGVNARSPCGDQAITSQCVNTTDGASIQEMNLIDVSCSPSGFSCGNQQRYDINNPTKCPSSTKNRFECSHQASRDCASNTCSGRGRCIDTLNGYVCKCSDGYSGPDCQKSVPCHHIKSVANGYVQSSGNTVSFSCKKGYQLNGVSRLTCSAGKYDNAVPTCEDINECQSNGCGRNSRCTNLPGSFKCDCLPGFKLSTPTLCVDVDECSVNNGNCQDKCINTHGSYSCSCRSGYRVSIDKHSCEDVNECSSDNLNNCMQECVNTRGSYKCQCKPGFNLLSDGSACKPVPCQGVQSPVNGRVSQGYGSYQTLVTYRCNVGLYRLNGPVERTCQANGKWSGREPTCDAVTCGSLPSPNNGQGVLQGNTYHFSCLKGFILFGDKARTCRADGTWTGKQPTCISYHCPTLNAPAHGQLVGHSYSRDSVIMTSCNEGYMLEDDSSRFRICQKDKTWSGKPAKCIVLSCGAPDPIQHGSIQGGLYNYNDKIVYKCNSGYGLSGNNVRTCQLNGQWSGFQPACLFNSCGYPGSLDNGELIGDDYSFGKSISYKCNAGYRLIGSGQRTCTTTGAWTNSKPTCQEILCPVPPVPVNGEVSGKLRGVGSKVTYDCLPGYSLKGVREISCGSDGQWKHSPPKCVSGVCGANKLVGPSGGISSPGFPNSYQNNQYCRYKISVAQSQKVAFNIPTFKTESGKDVLELRDGKSGHLLYLLSGVLREPLQITSPSNEMDIRFVTNGDVTFDGYSARYFASPCGGQITSLGQTIQTPNYPSNYQEKLSCSWQIVIPHEKFKLKFDDFKTHDNHDTLEAWSSISSISSQNKIGTFYGNRGTFLDIRSKSVMYLKFTSDSVYGSKGFRATVVKDNSY